jgi:hypothetical protein
MQGLRKENSPDYYQRFTSRARSEISFKPKLAGEPGFEPGLRGPEPRVLPLDDSPAHVDYSTELLS